MEYKYIKSALKELLPKKDQDRLAEDSNFIIIEEEPEDANKTKNQTKNLPKKDQDHQQVEDSDFMIIEEVPEDAKKTLIETKNQVSSKPFGNKDQKHNSSLKVRIHDI